MSLPAKLLISGIIVTVAAWAVRNLYPFLCETDRAPAQVLVIDGWIPTWDLRRAAGEYQLRSYKHVLVVRSVGHYDSIDLDAPYDDYVANILTKHGIPKRVLSSVLFPEHQRDRTYTAALAVKEWCESHNISPNSINVVTIGAHARRSRLLYRTAFGATVAIGIVGLPDPSYDANHWWRSSEGVREVLFEAVAYLYSVLHEPSTTLPPHLLKVGQ